MSEFESSNIFEQMASNQLDAVKQRLADMPVEEINTAEMNGFNLIHVAIISDNPEMLKEVLKYNVDVNKKEINQGGTPLHIAAEAEPNTALEFAQLLIDADANINEIDNNNTTSLMKAAFAGNTALVRLLVEKKADVQHLKCSSRGPGAIHTALEYNFPEIVTILVENDVDVNVSDLEGRSPLMLGASFDAVAACEELLKSKKVDINKQADDNEEYGYGFTALHFAVNQGAVGVTKLLLAHGIDVSIKEGTRNLTAVEFLDQIDDDVVSADVKEQLRELFMDC